MAKLVKNDSNTTSGTIRKTTVREGSAEALRIRANERNARSADGVWFEVHER